MQRGARAKWVCTSEEDKNEYEVASEKNNGII